DDIDVHTPPENALPDPYRISYDACPLCGSRSIHPLKAFDWSAHALYREPLYRNIHWTQCAACEHVFTDGYFSDEGLRILFQGTQAGQNPAAASWQEVEFYRMLWGYVLDRIGDWLPKGRWLDIGVGSGILLGVAHEMGYEVEGTDLRPGTVVSMRQQGF